MYRSLRDFVNILESHGELLRITIPVNEELEIAEITDRQSKLPGGGKALLFEKTSRGMAVLTNIFGSTKRMCLALGAENLDAPARRIDELFALLTE